MLGSNGGTMIITQNARAFINASVNVGKKPKTGSLMIIFTSWI
jgi:hypothetical protein